MDHWCGNAGCKTGAAPCKPDQVEGLNTEEPGPPDKGICHLGACCDQERSCLALTKDQSQTGLKSKRKVISWPENITGKRVYKGCDVKLCRNPTKEKKSQGLCGTMPSPSLEHRRPTCVSCSHQRPRPGRVCYPIPPKPLCSHQVLLLGFPLVAVQGQCLPPAPPTNPQRITPLRERCSRCSGLKFPKGTERHLQGEHQIGELRPGDYVPMKYSSELCLEQEKCRPGHRIRPTGNHNSWHL